MDNLEKQKKLLATILNITGGEKAAFYAIKNRIPSLKNISWEQLQQYKTSLESQVQETGKQKMLHFPKNNIQKEN